MKKYNKYPKIAIKGFANTCIQGYGDILKTLYTNDAHISNRNISRC